MVLKNLGDDRTASSFNLGNPRGGGKGHWSQLSGCSTESLRARSERPEGRATFLRFAGAGKTIEFVRMKSCRSIFRAVCFALALFAAWDAAAEVVVVPLKG